MASSMACASYFTPGKGQDLPDYSRNCGANPPVGTVACGIDANTDAVEGRMRGHGRPLHGRKTEPRTRHMQRRSRHERLPDNTGPGRPCDKRPAPNDVPKTFSPSR